MKSYQHLLKALMQVRRKLKHPVSGHAVEVALGVSTLLGKVLDSKAKFVSKNIALACPEAYPANKCFNLGHTILALDDTHTPAMTTYQNIRQQLLALFRQSDNTAAGLILVKKKGTHFHQVMNFFVSAQDKIYFIDPKAKLFPIKSLSFLSKYYEDTICYIQIGRMDNSNIYITEDVESEEKEIEKKHRLLALEKNLIGLEHLNRAYADPNNAFASRIAFKYFRSAIQIDIFCAYALYNLGICYKYGLGTQQNTRMAFRFFLEATKIDPHFSDAHTEVGQCYINGVGTAFNHSSAIIHFTSALKANRQHAQSWNSLGICYLRGMGVPQNLELAFKSFQFAVVGDVHYAKAWNNIGWCYLNGHGIMKDERKAFSAFKKATEVDPSYIAAWQTLGFCYQKGIGVQLNPIAEKICFNNIAHFQSGAMHLIQAPERDIIITEENVSPNDDKSEVERSHTEILNDDPELDFYKSLLSQSDMDIEALMNLLGDSQDEDCRILEENNQNLHYYSSILENEEKKEEKEKEKQQGWKFHNEQLFKKSKF